MTGKKTRRRASAAQWIPLLCLVPRLALAQSDSVPPVHATLRDWEQQAWLAIFDRGGSYFGRSSDRGIQQRFNERMDGEYRLDLISFRYTLEEVYEWYHRDNGARASVGSITHLQLVEQAEVKAAVPLGETWSTDVWFIHEQTLQARRSLIRVGFLHQLFGGEARAFLRSTLVAEKTEIDFEAGFIWAPGPGEITVAVGALDVFNDLIYQGLEVIPIISDSAIDYSSMPFTARVALDVQLGRRLRVEWYGLATTPTQVTIQPQSLPSEGFTQEERYGYTGGLLEWAPSERTAIGAFGTYVRSAQERTALPAGRPEDDFDLTEKSWGVGLYGIHRFAGRLEAEGWLARVWRTEDRVRVDTSVAPSIDYEDRSWSGSGNLIYRASSGFRAQLGLDFVTQGVVGPDQVPGRGLERDHQRLRFDLGWQLSRQALFVVGTNLDLDGDRHGPSFDGGHGRFALYW